MLKKCPLFSGNEPNTIGFDEEAQDSEFALQVVDDVHELWAALMARDSDPDDLVRATPVKLYLHGACCKAEKD